MSLAEQIIEQKLREVVIPFIEHFANQPVEIVPTIDVIRRKHAEGRTLRSAVCGGMAVEGKTFEDFFAEVLPQPFPDLVYHYHPHTAGMVQAADRFLKGDLPIEEIAAYFGDEENARTLSAMLEADTTESGLELVHYVVNSHDEIRRRQDFISVPSIERLVALGAGQFEKYWDFLSK